MDQPSEKGPALPSSQVQARACLPALERCEPSALALTVLAMGRLRQSWPLESLQTASSTLIYANPCKAESHIKYVADVGAILTNIDSKEETEKLAGGIQNMSRGLEAVARDGNMRSEATGEAVVVCDGHWVS